MNFGVTWCPNCPITCLPTYFCLRVNAGQHVMHGWWSAWIMTRADERDSGKVWRTRCPWLRWVQFLCMVFRAWFLVLPRSCNCRLARSANQELCCLCDAQKHTGSTCLRGNIHLTMIVSGSVTFSTKIDIKDQNNQTPPVLPDDYMGVPHWNRLFSCIPFDLLLASKAHIIPARDP